MGLRTMLGLKRRKPVVLDPAIAPWFAGKEFTRDFTQTRFPIWLQVLDPFRGRVKSILEIGSWEGRSAVFFLNFFPHARITCVDTFAGSLKNHPGDSIYPQHAAESEGRFEKNTSEFAGRVEKIKSRSVPALDNLSQLNRRYDLIYIDGSHEGDDVMMDSLLSWRMLDVGGLLIWDDYRWKRDYYRPSTRIDAFIRLRKSEIGVLYKGEQLISLRKSRPSG